MRSYRGQDYHMILQARCLKMGYATEMILLRQMRDGDAMSQTLPRLPHMKSAVESLAMYCRLKKAGSGRFEPTAKSWNQPANTL